MTPYQLIMLKDFLPVAWMKVRFDKMTQDKIFKQILINFLKDSIEEKGTAKILAIIENELGGWPILQDEKYDPKKYSILDKLLLLNNIDAAQLFQVHISVDPKNPKQNVLRVFLKF